MKTMLPRCYDSHIHFMATGSVRAGLRLFDLKSPESLADLKVEPWHFRGEWLVGFGWDESKWTDPKLPTRDSLDQLFPHHPVALSRVDGHAVWLNSKALEKIGCSESLSEVF